MKLSTSTKLSLLTKKIKRQELLFVALSMILILILLSSSTGKGTTGGSDSPCGPVCHGDESGTIKIELAGLPNEYQPETPYDLMVTLTDTSLSTGTGGVWIYADKGSLSETDSNLKASDTALVHDGTTGNSWNFTWTAPATGNGWATISIYGMVSDGSGNAGDSWNSTFYQINEIGGNTSLPPPPPEPSTEDYELNIITGVFLATFLFIGFIALIFIIDRKTRKE